MKQLFQIRGIFVILLFATVFNCGSRNPSSSDSTEDDSQETIEEAINAAKPIAWIVIERPSGHKAEYTKTGEGNSSEFTDAYAIGGFFVIIGPYDTKYISLTNAYVVLIDKDYVDTGSFINISYSDY